MKRLGATATGQIPISQPVSYRLRIVGLLHPDREHTYKYRSNITRKCRCLRDPGHLIPYPCAQSFPRFSGIVHDTGLSSAP